MIEFSLRNMRMWSRLGPSGAVGIAASELAKANEQVLMLTSDLCFFSGLDRFKNDYPDKLVNFGIAEQNMICAAAGLAKEGFIPFANTYASFCASRCADQVRVNMSYMELPIKLIGLTAGFGAGILGATHMSIEDVAVMRSLPNITVISPADCSEIIKALMASAENSQPTYIRLTGPVSTPIVHKEDYEFVIGKAITLREGSDICFIATGSIIAEVNCAAERLAQEGISSSVIDMHTIKPLDYEALKYAFAHHKLVVTVEEHSVYGGLGGAVSEWRAEAEISTPLQIIGIRDFFPKAGSYRYQLEQSGLTEAQIFDKVLKKFLK